MLADDVFSWLAGQPAWQRDLARRLASQVELTDEDFAEALAVVRKSFGDDVEAPEPRPLTRDDLALAAAGEPARLLGLGSLRGVGLIDEGEQLSFAPTGLTVIYGQNGVGKSTYVRTLKKLCRSVDRDCQVRANVYSSDAPPAGVKIKYDGEAGLVERRTSLDEHAVRLQGMSVFDAGCAELYVDAQNTIQYIPTELRLLARLATAQEAMRRAVAEERDVLQRQRPSLQAYPPDTQVARRLNALGDNGLEDLAPLSSLTDADHSRLAHLRAAVSASEASTARSQAATARTEAAQGDQFLADLRDLHARVSLDRLRTLQDAVRAAVVAEEAVELAAQELAGPVPDIGGAPWQLMWNAARAFVDGAGGLFPPQAGGHCPLCLQEVSSASAEGMQHFELHVRSSLQATADRTKSEADAALAACDPARAEGLSATALMVALRDGAPGLADVIDRTLDGYKAQLAAMSAAPLEAGAVEFETGPLYTAIESWISDRRTQAATLEAADNPVEALALRAELDELEARRRLASELDVFEAWHTILRRLSRLDATFTGLATNRITTAQRELTESEVGKALDAALTAELRNLSCGLPVELRAQTARAETSVGLRLLASDPPLLSEVASEGELRALALAFFLSELAVADDSGGIVLDDPVSSLDDERRIGISRRLVQEAASRQVIVFTHDLPFLFELRALAKKEGTPVAIQHIWRQGDNVGRVDEHPPFKTMNVRERVSRLETEVQDIRANPPATSDDAWRQVDGLYKRLRTTWERAVEERMFAGVVERFERDVKTQSLKDVKVTPDLIARVDAAMTRASRYVHEDAYAAQVPLPSVVEMAEDVEALRQFERDTRG